MRRLLATAILLCPVMFAPACDQPSRICDLVCECEHCNDLSEDYLCERVSASQDIAAIYECDAEWSAYADCVEDKGTCDEDGANFTTRETGSCSNTANSGLSCTGDSDCVNTGIPGARCENMSCVYTACNDGNGQPCSTDSDCPGGEDKCMSEAEKLSECITAASDDPSFVFFNFD